MSTLSLEEQQAQAFRDKREAGAKKRREKMQAQAERDQKIAALAYELLTKAQEAHFAFDPKKRENKGKERPGRLTPAEARELATRQIDSEASKPAEPNKVVPMKSAESAPAK